MKLYTILRNLIQSIKNALQEAKDYGESLRILDYANTVSPLLSNQTSNWTYTVAKDGELVLGLATNTRTYINVKVNGNTAYSVACTYGNGQPVLPVSLRVAKSDIVTVEGLSANCYLFKDATKFIPYKVGGVILNLLNNRRVVFA